MPAVVRHLEDLRRCHELTLLLPESYLSGGIRRSSVVCGSCRGTRGSSRTVHRTRDAFGPVCGTFFDLFAYVTISDDAAPAVSSIINDWFTGRFASATEVQLRAWRPFNPAATS